MSNRVLLAEDEPTVRQLIQGFLELKGFEVIAARDGEEAVALFKRESPDAVCLDLVMPKQNGFDACREIRQMDAHVPILFLSGRDDVGSRVTGLNIGADDYIGKPIDPAELIARLQAVLRRAKATDPTFAFGQNRIDPVTRLCSNGGNESKLSLREVQILEHFRDNPQRVLSREELYREVWQQPKLGDSRLVDQQLLVLRKKLHGDNAIQTVYGRGYCYIPQESVAKD